MNICSFHYIIIEQEILFLTIILYPAKIPRHSVRSILTFKKTLLHFAEEKWSLRF